VVHDTAHALKPLTYLRAMDVVDNGLRERDNRSRHTKQYTV